MTITAKLFDGTPLEFPDGTSSDVIQNVVKQETAKRQKPPTPFIPSGEKGIPKGIFDFSDPEIAAANPLTAYAIGAAKPAVGLMQLGSRMSPLRLAGIDSGDYLAQKLKDIEAVKQRGRDRIGYEGTDPFEMAGEITSPVFSGPAKYVPLAKTLGGKVLQGAAFGAYGGAATPVDPADQNFWATKGQQMGEGTGIGLAVPLAGAVLGKVGQWGYHGLIEPWANPAAIKGRTYLNAAGDAVERIKQLLLQNKQIVPGSLPTAGEAAVPASRAEFSALQESAKLAKPSNYVARADVQNQARLDAINEFAGTPAKRAEAVAAREAAAGPQYALGESQRLPFDVLTFGDLTKRPSMRSAIQRAQQLIEEQTGNKVNLPDLAKNQEITGADAQKIKLAYDDLIKLFPKSGMDTKELQAIKETRGKFVDWMEANFPALREARRTYKATSAPINQMDVGEAMKEKLTSGLRSDAPQKATGFANAVRESASTIKKATGEPRYEDLSQVLTGRQLQLTHNVVDDLARADRNLELARAGRASQGAQDVATASFNKETGGPPPTLLNRGLMMFNSVLRHMHGKVDEKLAAQMAAEMLHPPEVAAAMATEQVRQAKVKKFADSLLRARNMLTAGGVSAGLQEGD